MCCHCLNRREFIGFSSASALGGLALASGFQLNLLPVAKVKTPEEAAKALDKTAEVTLVYPATGSGQTLQACCSADNNKIVFLRHRSGPVYYWYEALSGKYPASGSPSSEEPILKGVSTDDVVVDDTEELLKKLRALYGLKNF